MQSNTIVAPLPEISMTAPRRQRTVSGLERNIVWAAIRLRIFLIICFELRSFKAVRKVYNHMTSLRKQTWGGNLKKLHKADGKYYFNIYTPGWPSALYDDLIRNEITRFIKPNAADHDLRFIFLAITNKCPLRCEHCFEWDNLNHKETFTKDELIRIVRLYQNEGVNQIQFSGGEPMVRINDLIEVIRFASDKCESYVVTSGFNLTKKNARSLKEAGCRGMIVSIDHYIPERHNRFRHHPEIFGKAVEGVRASLEAGMVTALSVCATREFIEGGHLAPYFEFAKDLGVHFVQILEPKAVGHYQGKDVQLEEKHILILEQFFKQVNYCSSYKNYPTLMYHGYHQRRVGCYAGTRSVYIDSAGNVHACPFCHTSSYNIRTILQSEEHQMPVKENYCPRYGKIA